MTTYRHPETATYAGQPCTIERRGFLRTYILDADGVAHGPFWSARGARSWLNEREELGLGDLGLTA